MCAKAQRDSSRDRPIDPIAKEAANLRCRCLARAMTPAAKIGSAGINHRLRTIQLGTIELSTIEAILAAYPFIESNLLISVVLACR